MSITYINPDDMYRSAVFSQGIVLPANARLLLVGGQNGVNEKGEVVDKGDVARQTARALANMQKVLRAAGASIADLVKVTIILHHDADLQAGFAEWMKLWGTNTNPPTVTALRVAGFANPDVLIEIEAQAVLP